MTDVQVNGTSVLSSGVANIPLGTGGSAGALKVESGYGINANGSGRIYISGASENTIKDGLDSFQAIVPIRQHMAVFYGLAKAAGDSTQSASSNTVGNYTDAAKVAIQKMLGIYEAPWELIREDTFTYTASTVHQITTDENGQPFELTDAVLMFETPVQATDASLGSGGNLIFTNGSSNIASVYCGGWTQAANASAHGAWIIAENKNGLVFV